MQWSCGECLISDDRSLVHLGRVHSWLTETYWNEGCTLEYVERAFNGSRLAVGSYLGDEQVGCLRVVSDGVSFAWVADVYVDPGHRGKGVGKMMLRFALEHPEYQDMKRWLLATRHAHGLYEQLGFGPLRKPQNFLVRDLA